MNQPAAATPADQMFDWAWKHKLLMIPIVLALVLSICSGLVGLIYISALNGIRSNPLYVQTMELASANPQLIAAMGEPIMGGFIEAGQIDVDDENEHGSADVEIPMTGPLDSGRLLLQARLVEGKWTIDKLTATLESGKVIVIQ